jgi:hypothetical protein
LAADPDIEPASFPLLPRTIHVMEVYSQLSALNLTPVPPTLAEPLLQDGEAAGPAHLHALTCLHSDFRPESYHLQEHSAFPCVHAAAPLDGCVCTPWLSAGPWIASVSCILCTSELRGWSSAACSRMTYPNVYISTPLVRDDISARHSECLQGW